MAVYMAATDDVVTFFVLSIPTGCLAWDLGLNCVSSSGCLAWDLGLNCVSSSGCLAWDLGLNYVSS